MWLAIVPILVITATTWGFQPARAEHPATLTIAAANSLREPLKEVLPLFEAQHKGINIRIVYGPSQNLREQIEQGAPVDVYLPSSLDQIEFLQDKGLTVGAPQIYGSTALVLITGNNAPVPVTSIQDLRKYGVRRIAIGDPKTSSVGKFAAKFLKNTNLDQELRSRYVYGEHSGAVLDLVAKGEADVGLVYRTDVAHSRKVRIVAETPADSHPPVIYGLAAAWTVRDLTLAREFGAFLVSAPAQAVLREHGFDQTTSNVSAAQR
jgi:molybdate transport system substrate-binding protein